MASNFDFLKDIDNELFCAIEDAQKLFCDEYFNQCAVQTRIFAEKMAKKTLGSTSENMTFDDTLNCLKDKIKTREEQEFTDDLFFIKKLGNKCAHGEDVSSTEALESIQRAFEASINYAYSKKKNSKILSYQFDVTMLITGKKQNEVKLVDKYIELAQEQKEELLNLKQGEFNSQVDKNEEGIRNESFVQNPKKYKQKAPNPAKERVKSKIKAAKKNLRENINKETKSPLKKSKKKTSSSKKTSKKSSKKENKILKLVLYLIFVTISLIFITKMLVFF